MCGNRRKDKDNFIFISSPISAVGLEKKREMENR